MANAQTTKALAVFNIVDTGGDKPFWNRIGTAFRNKDDSLNVVLSALPVDGKLHIRVPNGNGKPQKQ